MTASPSDLVDGVAQLLADSSIGVYDPSGLYADTDIGITVCVVPDSPSQIITLTPYTVQDDPRLNDSILALQVRLRGTQDPRSVIDRSAAIFNLLHGLEADYGDLHVALMWRQASGPMGQDDNQRWLWSDSFYCRVNWPTLHRVD